MCNFNFRAFELSYFNEGITNSLNVTDQKSNRAVGSWSAEVDDDDDDDDDNDQSSNTCVVIMYSSQVILSNG